MASTTKGLRLLALTIIFTFMVSSTNSHTLSGGKREVEPLPDGCTSSGENTIVCTGDIVKVIPTNLPTTIQRISFSKTAVTEIPADVLATYPELTFIDFRQNKLTAIAPGAFSGLPKLERLYLQDNSLSDASFGTETFTDLATLKNLFLDDNQLTKLPESLLSATTTLQSLEIKNNSIDQNGVKLASPLNNLTQVDLSRNLLASLDKSMFDNMPQLELLTLNYNKDLTIKTEALKALNNLETFEATNLDALTLEADIFNEHLKNLYLNNNPATTVSSSALTNAIGLKEIRLNDCGLFYLDGDLFNDKVNLTTLRIMGNPFLCNCHLRWMAEARIAKKEWAAWNELNSPQCGSPSWLSSWGIYRLLPVDFTCDKPHIEAISETFINYTRNGDLRLKAIVDNGMPITQWAFPDGTVNGGSRSPDHQNHSVHAIGYVRETFNLTGLHNFTLIATNVAGESDLTFTVLLGPLPPNGALSGPSVPTFSALLLLGLIVNSLK